MSAVHSILCIETATKMCSVAILNSDGNIFWVEENANKHISHLTAFIETCLKNANVSMQDLKAVAVSSGPGSYTALRAGISSAKGLCFALDIPLISVNTLESLAHAAFLEEKNLEAIYTPCIDARRDEIYTAHYVFDAETNGLKEIEAPNAHIVTEDSFRNILINDRKIVLSGDGAEKTKRLLNYSNTIDAHIFCSAKNLLHLAAQKFSKNIFEDLAAFTPFYLKPPNITVPKKNYFS